MGQGSLMWLRKDTNKHAIYHQQYVLFCYCCSNIVYIVSLYHSKLYVGPYKVNYMFFTFVAFSIVYFLIKKNYDGQELNIWELFHFS